MTSTWCYILECNNDGKTILTEIATGDRYYFCVEHALHMLKRHSKLWKQTQADIDDRKEKTKVKP